MLRSRQAAGHSAAPAAPRQRAVFGRRRRRTQLLGERDGDQEWGDDPQQLLVADMGQRQVEQQQHHQGAHPRQSQAQRKAAQDRQPDPYLDRVEIAKSTLRHSEIEPVANPI